MLLHLLFDFMVCMHGAVATQVRQRPLSCTKENAPDFTNKDVRQGADWPLLTGTELLNVLRTHKEPRLVTCCLVLAAVH